MGQTVRFHETLRRLAMIDETFVEDEARLGLDLSPAAALNPRTAALLQLGVSVATGSSAVCLEWSTGRALAAGASEDEIADVLLAIAPVAGLGRVAAAALGVATALGCDLEAAPRGTTATDRSPAAADTTQLRGYRKEPGKATRDQPADGRTAVLRRRPARIVAGRAEGPYSDAFEIICDNCGDRPGLDYTEVSPKLQLIRGPYSLADGIAAYEAHLSLHHQAQTACHPDTTTDAG
jgi:alkylhydroperoxidase/carboxymuconolactone decarboxylase family protein YurZ